MRRTQLILKYCVIAYLLIVIFLNRQDLSASHYHFYNLYQQGMVTPRSLEELAKSVELAEGSSVEQSIQVPIHFHFPFHICHLLNAIT